MFYRKNLYTWEQALRVAASLAVIVYIWMAMPHSMLAYALIASAALFAVTGIVGFCPACAMVGRKLKQSAG